MGNTESAPSDEPSRLMNTRLRTIEETSTTSSDLNTDWDHNVPVTRDENLSPNDQKKQVILKPRSNTWKCSASPTRETQLTSHQRRPPRDPEEDRYSQQSMDEESSDEEEEEEEDDDEYGVFSDNDILEERTATSMLMDASAAVFHMLMTGDSDSGFLMSDDISYSDRSAAVFDHLQQESMAGNDEPVRQFLGTAQAVSDVMLKEKYNRQPPSGRYDNSNSMKASGGRKEAKQEKVDDFSVSQQRASIFAALERSNDLPKNKPKKEEDARRSPPMMEWLETNAGDDAQSEVSEISDGIFKIMDETKRNVDEESVSEFSAAVFKILDNAGKEKESSHDKRDDDESDVRSISERSCAIFKVLDKSPAQDVALKRSSTSRAAASEMPHLPSLARPSSLLTGDRTIASHLTSQLQPKSDPAKLMQRNIFHLLAQRTKQSIPVIEEEDEEDEEDRNDEKDDNKIVEIIDADSIKEDRQHNPEISVMERREKDQVVYHVEESPRHADVQQRERHHYLNRQQHQPRIQLPDQFQQPKQEKQQELPELNNEPSSDFSGKASGLTEPVAIFSEVIHADSSEQEEHETREAQEEIDMFFVERFDYAFDQFIGMYPKFVLHSPELVKNLRITKLQKLLEYMDTYERNLLTEMAKKKTEKHDMEKNFQYDLREASRRKAERQITLQSELAELADASNYHEAKWTWKIVSSSEARAKKQYIIRQNQKCKKASFAKTYVSGIPCREELLSLLPQDEEGSNLKAAIHSQRKFISSQQADAIEQEELRKHQVDNAFMVSEIAVLRKKLTHLQTQAKRLSWVDTILLRMDKVHMAKLKQKYCNKLGVTNLE